VLRPAHTSPNRKFMNITSYITNKIAK